MNPDDTRKEFDRMYSSCTCVWGLEADKYLAMHLEKAPIGYALDAGCGEGRHAIYLAQHNYTVDAVDMSEKALERLKALSCEYGVESLIFPKCGDLTTIDLPREKYDLVVLSFVFPFMRRSDIITALTKVKTSLRGGGCIYISALTVDDTEYKTYTQTQHPVEPRTFYSNGLSCYCYFFERGELKTLFSDFRIINYTETDIELNREPYTHSMCLLFAQKVIL
jgi:SAM-dependent methyltransferase